MLLYKSNYRALSYTWAGSFSLEAQQYTDIPWYNDGVIGIIINAGAGIAANAYTGTITWTLADTP